MKKLLCVFIIAIASCNTGTHSVVVTDSAIIISKTDSLRTANVVTDTTESQAFMAAPAIQVKTDPILHVIALNAKESIRQHKFVMVLPSNYLTDTSFGGKLVRQLKYMNLQGSHGAIYPATLYPNDTLFYNGQGRICELWVYQTQAQIDKGSKDWIENLLDTKYAKHNQIMENARGRKIIYPNL